MKYCDTCRASYPNEFNVCPKDQSPLRVTSELFQGMVIRDKYRIEEKIGAGGMATVYRARHLAFNEQRALKVVKSQLAEDEGFLRRFRTEAVVTRKLQHPNAVRVDDLDTTEDGRPFIVMEFVQGRNLRQVIAREGPFTAERAVGITRQVALALDAAHRLGITHRDIKPDNILLTPQADGHDLVKVLDFGIAKIREGSLDVGTGYTATGTGMVVGTPQYISPEQAMGKHGEQIDGRSDLYSLGVVTYEMLTGRLPFVSDTPMGLVLHHIQTVPEPPDRIRPDLNIPSELSALLMKVLEKDRQRRVQSAMEMVHLLDRLWQQGPSSLGSRLTVAPPGDVTLRPKKSLQSGPVPASMRPHGPESADSVAKSTSTGRILVLVVGLLVFALGSAAVLWFATHGRTEPPAAVTQPKVVTPPAPVSTPVATDDQTLTATVRRALGSTSWGRESSIEIAATDGVVTLTGKASKTDGEMASALVGAIPGVVRVVNQINTENPTPSRQSAPPRTPKSAVAARQPPSPDSAQLAEGVRQLVGYGNQQLDAGDYGSAISSFQSALSLDPSNAGAKSGLDRAKKAEQTEKEILMKRKSGSE